VGAKAKTVALPDSHPSKEEKVRPFDDERGTDADPSTDEPNEQNAYPEGDSEAGPQVGPGAGGYAGRDPKTDMPAVPSVPETQDDPKSHDAAPDPDSPEPPASN
jgi:hypothetical protein